MAGRDDVSLPDSVGSDESDMLSVSDSEPEVPMDVEGEEDVVSLPPSFGSDDEFDQGLVSLPSSCEFDSDPSVPDDHDDMRRLAQPPKPSDPIRRRRLGKNSAVQSIRLWITTFQILQQLVELQIHMTAWSFTALLAFCRWPQSFLAPRASSAWALKLAGTSDAQSCGVSLLSCSPVARFRCCFYRLPAQYFPLSKISRIRRDARQKNGNRDGSKAAFLGITAAKQPRFRYEEKGASCTNTRCNIVVCSGQPCPAAQNSWRTGGPF